jgi:hypothetical protein
MSYERDFPFRGLPADVSTPAAEAAAVITYAAPGALKSNVLAAIYWSYSAAPTGGNIKVEDGAGNTIFNLDITSAGPGFLPFNPPKKGTYNAAMIITLAAGGSGVTGKLSLSHWVQGQ